MTAIFTASDRPDGRSRWERRRRTIVRQLTAGLGREPTPHDKILINAVAAVAVRNEQLAAQIVTGGHTDDAELVRLGNVVSRLVNQLGKPTGPKRGQTLETYIASKYGSAA